LNEALLEQAPWIDCSFNQTMSRDFLLKGTWSPDGLGFCLYVLIDLGLNNSRGEFLKMLKLLYKFFFTNFKDGYQNNPEF
jgi:hypothetical protein